MSEATPPARARSRSRRDIRKAMGLSAQDRVVSTRLDDGTTIMRAKTRSIVDLKGLLKRGKGAAKVKIEDMNIGRD